MAKKKRVIIYRLLTSGTIEEKIYQRQIAKEGLSDSVMDVKDSKRQFTVEELKDIFSLQEGSLCNTHELMDCHCEAEEPEIADDKEDGSLNRKRKNLAVPQKSKRLHLQMDSLREWKHFSLFNLPKTPDGTFTKELKEVFDGGAIFCFERIRDSKDSEKTSSSQMAVDTNVIGSRLDFQQFSEPAGSPSKQVKEKDEDAEEEEGTGADLDEEGEAKEEEDIEEEEEKQGGKSKLDQEEVDDNNIDGIEFSDSELDDMLKKNQSELPIPLLKKHSSSIPDLELSEEYYNVQ